MLTYAHKRNLEDTYLTKLTYHFSVIFSRKKSFLGDLYRHEKAFLPY